MAVSNCEFADREFVDRRAESDESRRSLGGLFNCAGGARRIVSKGRGRGFVAFAIALSAAPVRAEEEPSSLPLGIEVHGFASQGFIYTTANQFLAESDQGSFEFTEVGLNFTKQLTDEFRFGAQLFVRDLGPIGNYKPVFDWFYIDYHFFDWFGLRAGRTKLPFGLYNETSDIDAARAPILLPQAMYSARNRDWLLAQTGFEAYGYLSLAAAGALDYRLFGGTIYFEPPYPQANVDYSLPYVVGARALWSTPINGLSAAFSALALRLNQDAYLEAEDVTALQTAGVLDADYENPIELGLPIKVWAASLEYLADDLSLAAEYTRLSTHYEISEPKLDALLFPAGVPYPIYGKSYYVMASYRVAPWFTPGAYYSVNVPNVDLPARRDRRLDDVALFVRYDLNAHLLVKLEAHYMSGTAGLEPKLNGLETEDELKSLTKVWGAFLFKTTGYF